MKLPVRPRIATWWLAPLIAGSVHAEPAPSEPEQSPHMAIPTRIAPLVEAMSVEQERARTQLGSQLQQDPYYVGYWLLEWHHVHVEAKYGALTSSDENDRTFARAELRVGSMELDNSNYFGASSMLGAFGFGAPMERAPLDADPLALRRTLWLLTDDTYQNAVDLFDQKAADRKSSVKQASQAADFSEYPLSSIVATTSQALPDTKTLEQRAMDASRVFLDYPDVHDGTVTADAWRVNRVFVTDGGVRSFDVSEYVSYTTQGFSQATDGMPLVRTERANGGVTTAALEALTRSVAQDLEALRTAPVVEDYNGPVLFEGLAAAQMAHEFLGATLSGTPNGESADNPWLRRLGKRVLPQTVDVFDDPTLSAYRGLPLFGGYAFDDDGVPGQRVELIEKGRLRSFLMSRTPNEYITRSNGHGRTGAGGWSQGSIGNLVLEPRGGVTRAALRKKLLEQVKAEGGKYGLVVQALEPRDYSTGGMAPPATQRVLRLYLDGREEWVRGAELHQMTPRDLKDVLATGNSPAVFTFHPMVGGAVPGAASVASPDLLLEDVEIRRPSMAHELPPVLPRPSLTAPTPKADAAQQ